MMGAILLAGGAGFVAGFVACFAIFTLMDSRRMRRNRIREVENVERARW
jgi:hypothetical protein